MRIAYGKVPDVLPVVMEARHTRRTTNCGGASMRGDRLCYATALCFLIAGAAYAQEWSSSPDANFDQGASASPDASGGDPVSELCRELNGSREFEVDECVRQTFAQGPDAEANAAERLRLRHQDRAAKTNPVDKNLSDCLFSAAQQPSYSSFDGGISAVKMLTNDCVASYGAWEQACEVSSTLRDCTTKGAIIAQMALKMRGK